jgi:hypothetical protein
MVCHRMVVKFHVWVAQRTVLGDTPPHASAPELERTGREFSPHQANHLRLTKTEAGLDGLKRGSVFPSHLNHGRAVTHTEVSETITRGLGHEQPDKNRSDAAQKGIFRDSLLETR